MIWRVTCSPLSLYEISSFWNSRSTCREPKSYPTLCYWELMFHSNRVLSGDHSRVVSERNPVYSPTVTKKKSKEAFLKNGNVNVSSNWNLQNHVKKHNCHRVNHYDLQNKPGKRLRTRTNLGNSARLSKSSSPIWITFNADLSNPSTSAGKLTMSTTLMESIDNTHKPIVTLTGGPKGAEWMCQTTPLVISLQKMNKHLFQCPCIYLIFLDIFAGRSTW